MTLPILNKKTLLQVAQLMTADVLSEEDVGKRILTLVEDPLLVQRAMAWLPEAFGWVLASKIGKFRLPGSFQARTSKGEWSEFPLSAEPLFNVALSLAEETFQLGLKALFEKLALRSAVMSSLNAALDAGVDVNEAVISGPAFLSLPAEIYEI